MIYNKKIVITGILFLLIPLFLYIIGQNTFWKNWAMNKTGKNTLLNTTSDVDLKIDGIIINNPSYSVTYCNNGIASSSATFRIKLTNLQTGQHFDGDPQEPLAVPLPGNCTETTEIDCNLIGNPSCSTTIQVKAEIDWEQQVPESNETNNMFILLISEYLKQNPGIIEMVSKTTPFTFGSLPSGADRKIESSLRMLGYALVATQTQTIYQRWIQSFQQSHSLPVNSIATPEFITALDLELLNQEGLEESFLASFPVDMDFSYTDVIGVTRQVTYVPNAENYPSKNHVRYFMASLLGDIPTVTAPMTVHSLGNFFFYQGFRTIRYQNGQFILNYIPSAPPYNEGAGWGLYKMQFFSDFHNVGQVIHEYAHHTDRFRYDQWPISPNYGFIDTTTFNTLLYDMTDCLAIDYHFCKALPGVKVVSGYVYGQHHNQYPDYVQVCEGYAESFSMYYLHGEVYRALAALYPDYQTQYDWLKTHAFNGVEFCGSNASLISNQHPYWDYRLGKLTFVVSDISNEGLYYLLINDQNPKYLPHQIVTQCQPPTPTPSPTPTNTPTPTKPPEPTPDPTATPTPIVTPTPYPITIQTTAIPIAYLNKSYAASILVSDPNREAKVTIAVKGLPRLLSFSPTCSLMNDIGDYRCSLYGTPVVTGNFSVYVFIQDQYGVSASKTYTLPVPTPAKSAGSL